MLLQFPLKYSYSCAKGLEFKPIAPTITEKDRNECSTTQTIRDFFRHIYTQEIAEGVPDELVFNADEIFAEVGVPTKVMVPPNEKRGPHINGIWKLLSSCQVSIEKRKEIIIPNDIPDGTVRYLIPELSKNPDWLPDFEMDRYSPQFPFT